MEDHEAVLPADAASQRILREKIEDDATNPTLIRTVWGIGYRLELP